MRALIHSKEIYLSDMKIWSTHDKDMNAFVIEKYCDRASRVYIDTNRLKHIHRLGSIRYIR